MSRIARLLPLALVAAVAALAAFPAFAADDGGVQVVEAGSALFPDRAYVLTLSEPRDSALTTEDVTVTEDGKPVTNLSVLSAASAEGIGTVLLIDASNSMKGSIDSAMQAARAFAARNPGQPLSVVFFNTKPTVALPLTTDRAKVNAVLAKAPKLAEGTRINDALVAAVAQVRGSQLGAARVVLLSDGDDVGSVTSLDSALAQLDAQRIRVFTIGIQSPDFIPDDLERIADDTGGSFALASSPSALTEIYDELGFQLSNEYLLRYRSAAQPDQDVARRGRGRGRRAGLLLVHEPVHRDGGAVQAGVPGRAAPVAAADPAHRRSGAPARLLHDSGAAEPPHQQGARRAPRRVRHACPRSAQPSAARRSTSCSRPWAPQKQRKRSFRWMEGFAEDVDVAQIRFDPTRMVWVSVVVGLVVGVVAGALIHPIWFLLALVPPIALNLFVRNRARKQRNEFAEQLPENLDVLASALRAGHSLAGAMGVVADEAPEPSKREFTRVVTDEQLGIPLDEALEVTAKRMQNPDMDQVAVLALVQREAGGNTAEVLDQVIANIRARMDVRRLVTSSRRRASSRAGSSRPCPVGIFVFLIFVNPSHLDPLFHDPLGQVAAIMAIFMVLTGFYMIRRIVSIEL